MRCHSASSHSWISAIELPPALLNSSVSPPSCSCASRAASCIASKSVTSTAYATPSISPATCSGAFLVDVDDRDARTFGGHPPARGRADTRRAAGDERALTVEQTHAAEPYPQRPRGDRGDALA